MPNYTCPIPNKNTTPREKMDALERYKGTITSALFAGGCFWCSEAAFEKKAGVIAVVSGYIGPDGKVPTYDNHYGFREGVEVFYDPEKVSYRNLVELFWETIDPTDSDGQFADRGFSYTTAVYYRNNDEKVLSENLKQALEESGRFTTSIAVKILPAETFYPAEEYHQFYAKKHPFHYSLYHEGSGRAAFFAKSGH